VNLLHAIVLGLIQGLSEFLPISSTAHLTIAGNILHLIDPRNPEAWTAFIAIMQLGTVTAVVLFFRKELWCMARALLHDVARNGLRSGLAGYSRDSILALYIALGSVPIAVVGLTLRHVIEGALTKNLVVIVGSLIMLAALLWIAEKAARHERGLNAITWKDALVIGGAQVLALVPGASRSGTTITAALFLGISREDAARFSFLLSIPAVIASGLLEAYEVYKVTAVHPNAFNLGIPNLVVATIVAGVAGYATIAWLLRYLMKNTTMVFVWYRFLLGLGITILLFFGVIQP
jgi:undecaprenyl-diphosphatase